MVSNSKGKILKNKVDPCAKSSKRVMANSVLWKKVGKGMHSRCEKIKSTSSIQTKGFVCERYADAIKGIADKPRNIIL